MIVLSPYANVFHCTVRCPRKTFALILKIKQFKAHSYRLSNTIRRLNDWLMSSLTNWSWEKDNNPNSEGVGGCGNLTLQSSLTTTRFYNSMHAACHPAVFLGHPYSRHRRGRETAETWGRTVQWLLFVGCLTSHQHAGVSQGQTAQTIVHAATLRYKVQIKLTISPSHSMLTPGQPVPLLTR